MKQNLFLPFRLLYDRIRPNAMNGSGKKSTKTAMAVSCRVLNLILDNIVFIMELFPFSAFLHDKKVFAWGLQW